VFRLWQRMFELSFLEAGRKMGHDGLARTSETLVDRVSPRILWDGTQRRTGLYQVMFIGGDFVFIVACISGGGTAVTSQIRSGALVSLL